MWWNKRESEPEVEMTAGDCECGHSRCCHENGKGRCHVHYPADKEWPNGAQCACQVFIRDDDYEDDDTPETPIDPEVAELERMVKG